MAKKEAPEEKKKVVNKAAKPAEKPAVKKKAAAAAKKTAAPAVKKAATAVKKAAAPEKVPDKSSENNHVFSLSAPNAHWASVVGSFNNWRIEDGAMKRDKGGPWTKSVKLKPGKYEYKFVVDGEWWADPDNPHFVYNQHGTTNSVLKI